MDPAFSYMVLGQYPAKGSNQLISRDWVYKARSRWDAYVAEYGQKPPAGTKAIMGLDIAELGIDSNCQCFRWGSWVEPLITWGGVDVIQTGDRAHHECEARSVAERHADATGVGAGVPPHMNRLGSFTTAVKVASSPTIKTELGEFGILRDQLWWSCREWLRTDTGAMLPPDEQLMEELLVPTYQVKGGKIKIMDKDTMRDHLKRSPDRADALCLTFAPSGELEYVF
jgi:hypothetical protein